MKIDEAYHVISLKTNGARLRGGEVLMDGKLVKGVRSIRIAADIESPATVVIEMLANVNSDMEAELK